MPWGRVSPLGANDLLLLPGKRLPPSHSLPDGALVCIAAGPLDANPMTLLINVVIWAHGGAVSSVLK